MSHRLSLYLKLLFLLCITVLPSTAWAGTPPELQTNGDVRLGKLITVVGERLYLGELLEELSKQSGVPLSAGDEDGAAGERVSVHLKNVPLRDVMESLWSLVSYQKAEWKWDTTGDSPAQFTYRLARPRAARYLSVAVQGEVQAGFEKHAATLLQGLHMTPEERKQLAQQDPAAGALIASSRIQTGLSIFEESLSDEDKTAVLNGSKEVTVPVNSLSPVAQELARSDTTNKGIYTKSRDGSLTPVPPATSVTLLIKRFPGDISPTLIIDIGGFGHGYMGGDPLNNQWKKKVGSRWMLPGDSADDPAETRTVPPPTATPIEPTGKKRGPLFAYLNQTAKVAPLSFLAHLPRDQQIPKGKTVAQMLQSLDDSIAPAMQHKWRFGVLLLSPANYIVENVEEERAPWLVVKKFRSTRDAAPQGLPSVRDFVDLSRDATAVQWKAMGKDAEFAPLEAAAQYYNLLRWVSREPERETQIMSPEGVRFSLLAPQLQECAVSDSNLATLLAQNVVSRVRLETLEVPIPAELSPLEPPRRIYRFTFLNRDAQICGGIGFFWEGIATKKN